MIVYFADRELRRGFDLSKLYTNGEFGNVET